MKYNRILPKDAFNDADLLKCIGKLVMDIEDQKLKNWQYHYDGENFNILFDENCKSTYVSNITFWYNSKQIFIFRPLNTKESWHLSTIIDDEYYDIFDDQGNVTIN